VIIQFPNNISQAEQPVKRIVEGAPAVVAETKDTQALRNGGEPSPEQVKMAADDINRAMQEKNQNLQLEFSIDTDTHKAVVKVTDRQTGELIRQIPTDETLAIARSIDKLQRNLLLSHKA
jgi:flagellar protein FlaG